MMPNIDPRTLKNMMAKMGIKSSDVEAIKVVITCNDKDIIVEDPQVTMIEAQGSVSFQIAGNVSEVPREVKLEISGDDVDIVMQSSGINDKDKAMKALEETGGDIAKAILLLKEEPEDKD